MDRLTAVAILSAMLLMLPPSDGHASCERSKRINHSKVDCLTAQQWETRGFFSRRSYAKTRNLCPEWGRVVAKVEIRNGADATWGLTDSRWRQGSWAPPKKVREVSCCTDLSDLCSKSDVLTTRGCESQLNRSEARRSCTDRSFAINAESCTVEASCKRDDQSLNRTSITAHYTEIETLKNCDGTLTVGSC